MVLTTSSRSLLYAVTQPKQGQFQFLFLKLDRYLNKNGFMGLLGLENGYKNCLQIIVSHSVSQTFLSFFETEVDLQSFTGYNVYENT